MNIYTLDTKMFENFCLIFQYYILKLFTATIIMHAVLVSTYEYSIASYKRFEKYITYFSCGFLKALMCTRRLHEFRGKSRGEDGLSVSDIQSCTNSPCLAEVFQLAGTTVLWNCSLQSKSVMFKIILISNVPVLKGSSLLLPSFKRCANLTLDYFKMFAL